MDVYERGTSIVCEKEMVLETDRLRERERESNSELVWMFIKERQRL